jgi:hypothetical protein
MKLRSFGGLFVLGLAAASSTALVVACSSSSSSGGTGDDAGTGLDATGAHDTSTNDDGSATADSAPDAGADVQTPCGDAGTCTSGQLCVTFDNGGGSCDQTILDAGVCPAGYVSCGVNDDGGMFGCRVSSIIQQCNPLPPECTNGVPSCNTCGTDLCSSCDCVDASATTATCNCLSP